MEVIDIRTFMLVLGIGNICFAGLLAGYARSGPVPTAVRTWQWARLVQGLAHLLNWLRPDLPVVWLAVAANCALIAGIMLEAAAFSMFFKVRHWQRILWPAAVLALVMLNGARFADVPPAWLGIIVSLTFATVSASMAWSVLRAQDPNRALHRIIGISNLIFSLAMLLRAAFGVMDSTMTPFTPAAAQGFTFLCGYVVMMINGFGFLLLCKAADDRKMERLAKVDSLTGVANRRAFFELTAAARGLASRQRHPISLMMLDIDFFKELNDRYGHAVGDAALCVFAEAVQNELREPDVLGRLGGEEFGVLLPGTDLGGALQAAERVRLAVRTARLPACAADTSLTVSIGVVVLEGDEDITAALARADRGMYAAKSEGRDRVVVGSALKAAA
jgi:diguanylate cyclase (GGDEF)-like protein